MLEKLNEYVKGLDDVLRPRQYMPEQEAPPPSTGADAVPETAMLDQLKALIVRQPEQLPQTSQQSVSEVLPDYRVQMNPEEFRMFSARTSPVAQWFPGKPRIDVGGEIPVSDGFASRTARVFQVMYDPSVNQHQLWYL